MPKDDIQSYQDQAMAENERAVSEASQRINGQVNLNKGSHTLGLPQAVDLIRSGGKLKRV